MWNIPSIPFVQSHTHTHTTSRSQCKIYQNPLEFITSSGLHYWFPVYPQLSAHVITPVIDFSKLDVIRRELMQTFTLFSSKIRAYSLNIEKKYTFLSLRKGNLTVICIIHFKVYRHRDTLCLRLSEVGVTHFLESIPPITASMLCNVFPFSRNSTGRDVHL